MLKLKSGTSWVIVCYRVRDFWTKTRVSDRLMVTLGNLNSSEVIRSNKAFIAIRVAWWKKNELYFTLRENAWQKTLKMMVGLESFLCFPKTFGGSFGVQPFVFLGRIWEKKTGKTKWIVNFTELLQAFVSHVSFFGKNMCKAYLCDGGWYQLILLKMY